jgi:hypothetical protein
MDELVYENTNGWNAASLITNNLIEKTMRNALRTREDTSNFAIQFQLKEFVLLCEQLVLYSQLIN